MNYRAKEEVRWALDKAKDEIERILPDKRIYADGWYGCIHFIENILGVDEL